MILPYRGRGNFLIKDGPCGVELCPALCPVRSDMEMHAVRRPVKGGPARIGLIKITMKLNRAGGPGVPRTPGRRPPHRNGGARRLSGYAAKSRSDAPTGGAQASPFLCFRPPYRRPMQKGWDLAFPLYSHERTTMKRENTK